MRISFIVIFLSFGLKFTGAIIAYDCGQKFNNFTTFSMVDVGDCNIPNPEVKTTKIHMTLLQINDYASVKVIYCKIQISRVIEQCRVWSHTASVKSGSISYLKEISRDECEMMHRHKTYKAHNGIIDDLPMNETISRPWTFAGSLKADGACDNIPQFSDPYGDYYDVFVHGYITISLEERYVPVNLNTDKIRFDSGTSCTFTDGHCIDSYYGHAFWNLIPLDACQAHRYTNLFTGHVDRVAEAGNERKAIYILDSQSISFAFKDLGTQAVCSFKLIKTEHPKLFLIDDLEKQNFPAIMTKDVSNIDLMAYVNSKFVYVEKHIGRQLSQLYYDILLKQCELERKILANAINIGTIAPDLLAYYLMQAPGFLSLQAGEAVHILRCIQVEVRVRGTNDCYQELPVFHNNKAYFMTPRTHILKEFGTKTICDTVLPVMHKIGSKWYKLLPNLTSQDPPEVIQPATKQTWKYTSPMDLANSGIYTVNDIEKLKTYIMFPNERAAVLDRLALGVTGKGRTGSGISITRLLDENALSEIAESAWNKMWSRFITFGSASAAFLAILIIFRLIKFILDTIIHGYALHSLYGWSLHVLGAFWNSLTHLLLLLGQGAKEDKDQEKHSQVKFEPAAPPASPTTPKEKPMTPRLDLEARFYQNTHQYENRLYPHLDEPQIPSFETLKRKRYDNDV